MDWQLVVVGACIVAALAVIVRRIMRWLRPKLDGEAQCGACSSCASSSSPTVMQIESLDSPATARR